MPALITASAVTGHRKLLLWYCANGHRNTSADRDCQECSHSRIERHAQIHASERAVVYRNPLTGEIRRPPRTDMPMDPKYVAQGYEREEIFSMIQHEKE